MTQLETIKTELVSDENGILDYDVIDHPVLRRAAVPKGIRIGEQFNVYYDESSKGGAVWRGSVKASLKRWLEVQPKQESKLKAVSDVAKALLPRLPELGYQPAPGYWCGRTFCVGVVVENIAEACRLGSLLGAEVGGVDCDRMGNQQIVVFRDAIVSY
ncbi:hypothetical protein [Devosia sp.]|uniref:hypothetical protein n=1 Tax=Devosia sp. TaxID=1871048 RepID=UPI002735A8E6|nr:hypothetical protein [Devosia sp.]MDP2780468.1 hypothetical protein [Devosia sp.]